MGEKPVNLLLEKLSIIFLIDSMLGYKSVVNNYYNKLDSIHNHIIQNERYILLNLIGLYK